MVTYPLEDHGGYLVTEAHGKRFLIDTGCPWSVSTRNDRFRFAEKEYATVGVASPNLAEKVTANVGTPVDALLGHDVLAEVFFQPDVQNGVLHVRRRSFPWDGSAVAVAEGTPPPSVELTIGRRDTMAILDTGAPIAYFGADLSRDFPATGQVEDFHPFIGGFTTPARLVPVAIAGERVELLFGDWPRGLELLMESTGHSVVVGTGLLEHFDILFALPERYVKFRRRNARKNGRVATRGGAIAADCRRGGRVAPATRTTLARKTRASCESYCGR